MSGIDLTEAVEAALLETCSRHTPAVTWRRDVADSVIRAALPYIERQVREQVAREVRNTPATQMEGVAAGRSRDYYDGVADGIYGALGSIRGIS